jgi:alkylhydroperoxidase family enzyme
LLPKLKEKFSEEQIVEIVSIIGLFNYINRFNNTFCILPE